MHCKGLTIRDIPLPSPCIQHSLADLACAELPQTEQSFPGLSVVMATAILMALTACPSAISAEETGTNFFLKASKSIPRIGRRSEYDNFFLKASKSVPRIGRRRELSPLVRNGAFVTRQRSLECLNTFCMTTLHTVIACMGSVSNSHGVHKWLFSVGFEERQLSVSPTHMLHEV